jgi:hypothetical protein
MLFAHAPQALNPYKYTYGTYLQNIELPIKIIAINCQLKLIAGLEKRQLIAVSPTII